MLAVESSSLPPGLGMIEPIELKPVFSTGQGTIMTGTVGIWTELGANNRTIG